MAFFTHTVSAAHKLLYLQWLMRCNFVGKHTDLLGRTPGLLLLLSMSLIPQSCYSLQLGVSGLVR